MRRFAPLLTAKSATFRIGLIPGDGIGQDIMPWARAVLETIDAYCPVKYNMVELQAGYNCFKQHGTSIPEATFEELKHCQGSVYGTDASPSPTPFGFLPPVVEMRRKLGLWANLRPIVSVPLDLIGTRSNVNMLVVRENTECLYVNRERLTTAPGVGKLAIAERQVSEKASKRIAKLAFQLAAERAKKQNRPGHVTIVHKANVLRLSEGLFLDCCMEIAKDYPDLVVSTTLIDSFMFKTMAHPGEYDVVLTTNTWGNLIANGLSPMVGGLGMVSGINLGDGHVMAEPIHGTPPHLENKNIANPLAIMRAAAGMADRLSPELHAEEVFERAVLEVLRERRALTPDIGGKSSTDDLGGETIRHFKGLLSKRS
jgi:homoisocitrate dehydrogenase